MVKCLQNLWQFGGLVTKYKICFPAPKLVTVDVGLQTYKALIHQSSHEGQEYSEVTCKLDEEFVGEALYCYVIVICWAYSHRILKVK